MAIQLSVFMENQPGKLEAISRTLSDNGVNLRGIAMASAGEFGVVRLIADDPEKAYRALKGAHFAVSRRRIVVVHIEDRPGSLHRVLELLSTNRINIEDCYGIVLGARTLNPEGSATNSAGAPPERVHPQSLNAAVVLEVEKFPEAERILREAGVRLLSDESIYSI